MYTVGWCFYFLFLQKYYIALTTLIEIDIVAEWTMAVVLGTILNWRGFESHRYHSGFFNNIIIGVQYGTLNMLLFWSLEEGLPCYRG